MFDKAFGSQKVQSNEMINLKPFISVKKIHSRQLHAFTCGEALGRGGPSHLVGGPLFQQCSLPRASPTTKVTIMQIFKNDMAQNMPLIGKPTFQTHNMLL
jgi:hypothetical protein